MMREAPGLFRVISYAALPFSRSPEKGAATSVFLASDSTQISGQYFTNAKVQEVKTAYNTPENRELLWNLSMDACRL